MKSLLPLAIAVSLMTLLPSALADCPASQCVRVGDQEVHYVVRWFGATIPGADQTVPLVIVVPGYPPLTIGVPVWPIPPGTGVIVVPGVAGPSTPQVNGLATPAATIQEVHRPVSTPLRPS